MAFWIMDRNVSKREERWRIMEKQPKRDGRKEHTDSDQTRYGGLRQMVKAASLFFGLGFFLAANVGVCIWLGWKFDGYFGTAPKGILAGILSTKIGRASCRERV